MKLSDFDTLALAHAHEETTDTKRVGSGQARGLFITEMGAGVYSESTIWAVFSGAAADITNPLFSLASAILITASDAGSYFGMDETKADGIANRAGIEGLVSKGVMTQSTADKFIAKTLSVTQPFKDVTQAEFDATKAELILLVNNSLLLPNSTEQKVYILNITKTAPKPTTIKIMQRFGADENDLTEWHQVGQFSNVHYKQQSYKAQIGACSCAYRELKVVSEYLLDMSIS